MWGRETPTIVRLLIEANFPFPEAWAGAVLVDDLPADRKQYGFDNLNFRFNDYRLLLDAGCVTLRALPDYAIIRIHTGQHFVNEDGKNMHEEPESSVSGVGTEPRVV